MPIYISITKNDASLKIMAAILKMAETRMVHAISYFITRQGNFMEILVLVLLIKIIYQLVAPLEEVQTQ